MKRGEIGHWSDVAGCTNLLFFAQLVDELLFDYSIPSNRISTLNCHYLCYDALSTIDGIENHGVPEGTLKPIIEELYTELGKDPVFNDEIKPTSYFVKYEEGKLEIAHRVSDLNYQESKRTTLALYKVFFEQNRYYERLKERIIDIVVRNNPDEQQVLFRLTKSLLTELMNHRYTLKYLYMVMNKTFWTSRESVDSPERIKSFFSYFDFQDHEYRVVFKIKKEKIQVLAEYIDDIDLKDSVSITTTSHEGRNFLKKSKDEAFVQIGVKEVDPYCASQIAKLVLENNISIYKLYNHDYRYRIGGASCGVFNESGNFFNGNARIKAVQHKKMPSKKQITEGMEIASKAMSQVAEGGDIQDVISLINAIKFHSHSLDSYAEENQLLDLWAIFETVLDVSNKHTIDRIQQICRLLVPLLKRKYVYSLFEQLAEDIMHYDSALLERITGEVTDSKEIVKKLCEFVLLESNDARRNAELTAINDFPLLRERISYYHEKLGTPLKAYEFVEKHATRVKWQVSRIYRNRNLIIHNGESMPYLNLLIENLHSYVDDFLDYVIHSFVKGNNKESMYQEVFIAECRWNDMFSNKSKESKKPITAEQIAEMLVL